MKTCSKCGVEKENSQFSTNNKQCKECVSEYKKEWYNSNKQSILQQQKEYREDNKDAITQQKKEYRISNLESIIQYQNSYYENNKDQILNSNKKWQDLNPEYMVEYRTINKNTIAIYNHNYYQNNKIELNNDRKTKYKSDPQFRIRLLFSTAINSKLNKQGDSYLLHIVYSIQELKEHLEKQFEPWMTWENQGKYNPKTWDDNDPSTWKWQIDHIIPHATFRYTSMEDQAFKECWALYNLRPLSAKQNIIDGDRKTKNTLSLDKKKVSE